MNHFNTYGPVGLLLLGTLILVWPYWRFVLKGRSKPAKRGLQWAPRWGNRCKDRLKRGEDPAYFGRCELVKGHYDEYGAGDHHHALERGMVNVRWDKHHLIRYEQS